MNTYMEILEFTSILEKLKEHAISENAKNAIDKLCPFLHEDLCRQKMGETTAARTVLDACGSPPLAGMKNLDETLTLSNIGAILTPEQLYGIALFSIACKRMAAYLMRSGSQNTEMSFYGRSFESLSDLQASIEACVDEEKVLDNASSLLHNLRRKKEHTESKIREKLNQLLQSRKQFLADSYITSRNGHFVLPVQRRYQNQFGGSVIDSSATGSTVFMEPHSVAEMQSELNRLAIEEDAEIRRILYTLTAEVEHFIDPIRRNIAWMEALDILFAKAKLSASMKARAVDIGGQRRLAIHQGRHPLLKSDTCVPLDIVMEAETSGVIITGPNTGGKTVAIKTIGLLSLMAQCGLHIPCAEGSYIAMQDGYWCDIGDSQNISQNLSTFSGHITNVIHILENASRDSLVIIDELGSGTDPAEGMGIAIAVLEELRQRGCMFFVTTHYPQVKTYAENSDRIQSARMAFDPESLAPLYQLEMGKSGESCALHIAKRLGLAPHMLERAHQEVYGRKADASSTPYSTGKNPKSKLVRTIPPRECSDPKTKFSMGDSVVVLPERELGIVYRAADETGDVVVQVKGQKRLVKHTRLQLKVAAAELYPPDYDFSIIFDTVANRKASHILNKRYDPDAVVVHEKDEIV